MLITKKIIASLHCLGVILSVFWTNTAHSQASGNPIKVTPLAITYSKLNGLPDQTIYDLLQDKQGFIWLATEKGIFRFDGKQFKAFRSDFQNSLAGASLRQDAYGRIWYENFDGYLFYVENDSLKTIPNQQPSGFYAIAMNQQFVYLHRKNALLAYDLKQLNPNHILKIIDEHISDVSTKDSTLVFADYNQILLLNDESSPSLKKIITPSINAPLRIYATPSSIFFCPKNNETGKIYEAKNNRITPITNSLKKGLVNKITVENNRLFLLTTDGVFVFDFDGKFWQEREHWLPGTSILSLLKDASGSIWLGTQNKGLLAIPDPSKQLIFNPPSLQLQKIIPTQKGFLGAGAQGQVYLFNQQLQLLEQIYQDPDSLPFISIKLDEQNQLLFLSAKHSRIYHIPSKKILSQNAYSQKDICKIDDHFYLIGTSNNAYLLKNPVPPNSAPGSNWQALYDQRASIDFLNHSGLQGNIRVRAVSALNALNLAFIASNRGLFIHSPKQKGELKFRKNGLFLQTLLQDNNEIWGLSQKGELLLIEPLDAQTFKISQIRKNTSYTAIKLGPKGVVLIDPVACLYLEKETHNVLAEVNLNHFGLQLLDAFASNEELYMLTNQGWLVKNLSDKEPARPGRFHVYGLNGNQKNFTPKQPIRLPWNKNSLDIHFYWFPGIGPNEDGIAYKINESNWNFIENEARNIHLEALNPGDYQITFKTGSKIWTNEAVYFSIEQPFWRELWFILGCALAGIGLISWFYFKRLKSIEFKNKLSTEKLILEKELNHSRLSSIRAQMNPHFFYNALNTIQAYIFQKDPENAIDYLNKFSKLTRMILDFSDKESVSLENELESLRMYLDLEKMRFTDQFDFSLTCDVRDTELIKIPSMIIQPYVENAIKHGLMHLKNGRKLIVSITEKDQFLEVRVDDNGIGRKKAGELNQIKQNRHQSFSTMANEKRLQILNRGLNKKVLVEYIDKTNPSGAALGTTVILRIPLFQ
ncbi:MAG: histidine kinase [Bacteroidetes bacterium]|nr:histidine kinase [Bacteroidota bacterium]